MQFSQLALSRTWLDQPLPLAQRGSVYVTYGSIVCLCHVASQLLHILSDRQPCKGRDYKLYMGITVSLLSV